MQTFDVIVIGCGQGGTPLAKKLAKAGLKTLIVEKRMVGGTCTNDGCTPAKAMIASGKRAHSIRHSEELGIHSGECRIDFKKIKERKDGIVTRFRKAAEKGVESIPDLTLLMGEARFSAPKVVVVKTEAGEETFTAEHIFISTGTTHSIPSIPGLDTIPYLTSTTLLDIEEIPEHLVILGGGYIALEFGQLFRRLGSQVTLIDKEKDFMSREDDDIAGAMKKILEEEGIRIHTHAEVQRVASTERGFTLTLRQEEKEQTLTGSHLLVATGRKPQTAALQTDQAGIEMDEEGYIKVDEYLQTKTPGVYALGDVKGGPAFTHIAYNDHLILLKKILHGQLISIKDRPLPYTMFTDPQLGRIGITEKEARSQGLNILVATLPMEKTARGIETGETLGLMKAVVDADTRQVLGAAILAAEGGEVVSILQMAMAGNIPYDAIREMIFAHPLYAESLNNLFMTLEP